MIRPADIPRLRLHQQQLTSPPFTHPADVVRWLGAVQAQEYALAKWAVGQRMRSATDGDIERAFAEGAILRTHVLRPTWHFVAPEDIRWMLELTAPRIRRTIASYARSAALDAGAFKRSRKVLASALRDGRQLTRSALRQALNRSGLPTDGIRAILMLMSAELDGLICSGPRVGREFTYALLDDRVSVSKTLTRDEGLAELAHRYFTSRGPATVQDFVWWSGLTTADARSGIELAGGSLSREVIGERICWLSSSTDAGPQSSQQRAFLLPVYDEYLVAYRDRTAALDPRYSRPGSNVIFGSTIVVNGRIVGTWKPTRLGKDVLVTLQPFAPLVGKARRAVVDAARRYGTFLGEPVRVEIGDRHENTKTRRE